MTPLQIKFLFGVFIYYILKGSIFVVLFVALVIVEKHARERQEQIRKYLKKKRAGERERWKVAYDLYEQHRPGVKVADETPAKPLSQLVNNPQSFTAYSSGERWKMAFDLPQEQHKIPAPSAPAAAAASKPKETTPVSKHASKPAAKPLQFSQPSTSKGLFTA